MHDFVLVWCGLLVVMVPLGTIGYMAGRLLCELLAVYDDGDY